MIAIGVTTRAEPEELLLIAGDPDRVFSVNDFNALQNILIELQKVSTDLYYPNLSLVDNISKCQEGKDMQIWSTNETNGSHFIVIYQNPFLILLLYCLISTWGQTLRRSKQKHNLIFITRDIAKVTHHRRQGSILMETVEGMPCCRGMFWAVSWTGQQRELPEWHHIEHSTGWVHQMQSCSQIVYWTSALMVKDLKPSAFWINLVLYKHKVRRKLMAGIL